MELSQTSESHHHSAAGDRLALLAVRYGEALLNADRLAAERVIGEALVAGVPPAQIQVRVVQAAMQHVGELWERERLTVAGEHVATVLSHQLLGCLREPLRIAQPRSRERIVLAAVEGEAHVLGLRMVTDVLEGAGFDVICLGADVPPAALHSFVAEHEPAIIGLSSARVLGSASLAEAVTAVHAGSPASRIVLGGHGVPVAWRDSGCPWVASADEVLDVVERLLERPPEPPLLLERLRGPTPPAASPSETTPGSAPLVTAYRVRALHDTVTGLPNRRAFDDRMVQLSAHAEEPRALLAIDVDHFRAVNDEEGQAAGDALLRRLGQTIRSAIRAGDVVARTGGDEFAVLLPACGVREARVVAEHIRAGVLAETHGVVTVSIGIAPLGVDARGAVIEAARALYAAKAEGRNRACAAVV
jgi:diguanylate cyclase (GGDEF)-like protein